MLTPVSTGDRCVCGSGTSRCDVTGLPLQTGANFGTAGPASSAVPGDANVDFMIAKMIPLRESVRLQFRSRYFNLFNCVNLSNPGLDTQVTKTFGRILTARDPRILQFDLKLPL